MKKKKRQNKSKQAPAENSPIRLTSVVYNVEWKDNKQKLHYKWNKYFEPCSTSW